MRLEGAGENKMGQLPEKTDPSATRLQATEIFGRGGGIRTRDPLHPMQVRYQAALHPDEAGSIARLQAPSARGRVQSFKSSRIS